MKETGVKKLKKSLSWFIDKQESSIIIATVLYMIVVTIVNPVFLSGGNLMNVFKQSGYTLITVVGMSLVLITGGLDLSVGSVLALSGVVTGMACSAGLPVGIAILLGIGVGALIGFINGFIIVKSGIPPLIVTLGMQYAARGMVSVLTKGVPIYPLPASLNAIDSFEILGIPFVAIFAIVLAVVAYVILKNTSFGRSVYALGGNEEAARISGINTKRTKMSVYIITSTLAAVAGVFTISRLGSAEVAAGTGYEMTVICGAIIGGISSFGGMGTIIGAAIGAFFMEVLTNSLTLMRISVYWQNVVIGVVLVVAVLLDQYKRRIMMKRSIKSQE